MWYNFIEIAGEADERSLGMIIAKNDEAKRSKIWKLVTLVSSVLIIVIAAYLLMKMFTANPLEGNWESEDGDLMVSVGVNGTMTVKVYDISEGTDVSVEMEYTLDKEEKTITITEDMAALEEQVRKAGGAYTEETLESALSSVATTFDYNIEGSRLILSEREYGEQLTFVKK